MGIRLHANATTPRQRAYIQQSSRPTVELAVELGISETTLRRWRITRSRTAPIRLGAVVGLASGEWDIQDNAAAISSCMALTTATGSFALRMGRPTTTWSAPLRIAA